MASTVTEVSSDKCFGGLQKVFSHQSEELKCEMKFSLFLPPKGLEDGVKLPVLYWLSGLTCTEQNFIVKSGFQRYAAANNVIVVGPDTSPRGVTIEGQDDDWDFGSGAGFYVNATQEKWKKHYRMYSYVVTELPALVESSFPYVLPGVKSISGHSMGGHGALICALKNPGLYRCTTAFAPICNPMDCPWGTKALSGYLGDNKEEWKEWDATHLVAGYNGPDLGILIDQGSADPYLEKQLKPKNLVKAFSEAKVPVIYRLQEGYEHGYLFVGTFLEDHIKHHAKALFA